MDIQVTGVVLKPFQMACNDTLGHEEHCLLLPTLVRKEFSGSNSKTRQAKACEASYKLVHIFPCEIHR